MIQIPDLKPGYLYRLQARNIRMGIWNPDLQGGKGAFIGIRTKFGNRYLDRELHYDADPHYGTATPTEELGVCPLDEKRDDLGTVCGRCEDEFDFQVPVEYLPYFEIARDSKPCETCGGDGYHPDAHWISESFYSHSSPFKIPMPPKDKGLMGHDGINRSLLIEQRCKRLGVPKTCLTCDGNGYVYTADECRLGLILWVLHPRKGCSRGWEIKSIQQSELPEVYAFLAEAAERNQQRFAGVIAQAKVEVA